jgi:hypothetical protein
VRFTPWKVPPAKPHHAATDVDREDDTAPGNHSLGTKKGLHSNERLDDNQGFEEALPGRDAAHLTAILPKKLAKQRWSTREPIRLPPS